MTINAPGAIPNTVIGTYAGMTVAVPTVTGVRRYPQSVPAPRTSRTSEIATSASRNPTPIPIPSRRLATGPFFDAKASARPRMMQFTTMSGMNMPRALLMASGAMAFIAISTIVTNPAMTTM